MSNSRVLEGPGFQVRFDNERTHLRAHVFGGTDSLQVSLAMWQMLGAECQAVGATRLLVLEELEATVDVADIDLVIDAMASAGLASVRIAFVELLDDVEGNEHAEIVGLERGFVIRIFTREDPARHWLLYGD